MIWIDASGWPRRCALTTHEVVSKLRFVRSLPSIKAGNVKCCQGDKPNKLDDVLAALVATMRATSGQVLNEGVVAGAKRMMVDAIGCAIGATPENAPQTVASIANQVTTRRPCTVIGRNAGTTAELAAFANGVLVRYLDLNDTYVTATRVGHPSDYIPAVLAAGEEGGADGRSILAAVSLVYEVYCGLMDGIELSGAHYDNVVYGSVASALGAAYLWGLSDGQIANAVGLALIPNIALRATRFGVVSEWKGCASGNACRNGLFAARLASRGITGPDEPFSGRGGLCEATGSTIRWDRLRRNDRSPAVLESHLKRYPAGFFAQTAIDAAAEIRVGLPPLQQIESIDVRTCDEALRLMANDPSKWAPGTRDVADHSLPYVVAVTLLRGYIDGTSFEDHVLGDATVRSVIKKVNVIADEACNEAWPEAVLSKVSVHLNDGRELTSEVRFHHGHARNPLSLDELRTKFMSLTEPVVGRSAGESILEGIDRLEEINAAELMRRCAVTAN